MMKLHNFFRSGTSHRLRIALNLKGLAVDYVPVDLRTDEQAGAAFRRLNPQGLVPVLESGEQVYTQSPAIIEWLEERYPAPPLLPPQADDRAHVRALAAVIGCDMHPLNNRRVLEYLRKRLLTSEAEVNVWCATWIHAGFEALEQMLAHDRRRGRFCFGDSPTLADVYLVPQVESARRFSVDMSLYPTIMAIDRACAELDAFRRAAPAMQPDAG